VPSKSSTAVKHERLEEAERHVGTIVADKYDVCQLIAVGGVGAVYRARHRFTGRQVALKLLKDQFSRDGAMAERFLREAKSAAEIGHPCIIDVVDAGVDDEVGVYVAFELLEGVDLAAALKHKTLTIGQILDVADAVLDALEAAHQAGVIHRDIKPPNIFLVSSEDQQPTVRVLDFGAAKRQHMAPEDSLTVVGTVIGTPAYMSPEQASAARVDPRTDVWSVGAVLFRAFADRPPFTASSPSLLLACIIRDTAPSLARFRPDLPLSLVAVIDRALQRSPELRWQSAGEMRDALRNAREGASVPPPARDLQPTVPDVPPTVEGEAQNEASTVEELRKVDESGGSAPKDATTLEDVPEVERSSGSSRRILVVGAALTACVVGVAFAYWAWVPGVAGGTRTATDRHRQPPSLASVTAALPASAMPTASIAAAPTASSPSAHTGATSPPPPTAPAVRPPRKTDSTSTPRPRVVPIREYE
jgi:eukaryotic-like serine/threonine-protein kinase